MGEIRDMEKVDALHFAEYMALRRDRDKLLEACRQVLAGLPIGHGKLRKILKEAIGERG